MVAKDTTLLFLEALGMVLRARVDIDQVAWVIFDAWAWESLAFLELLEVHWTFQDPIEETNLLFLKALLAGLDIDQGEWVVFDAWAWEFLEYLELPEAHWTFQDPLEETTLLFLEALWAGLDIDPRAWVVWGAGVFLELLEACCYPF